MKLPSIVAFSLIAAFSGASFSGVAEDAEIVRVVISCQEIYGREEAFAYVYDDDKKRANDILDILDRELLRKYSSKDVAKMYALAKLAASSAKPKSKKYQGVVSACRKFIENAQDELGRYGNILK